MEFTAESVAATDGGATDDGCGGEGCDAVSAENPIDR